MNGRGEDDAWRDPGEGESWQARSQPAWSPVPPAAAPVDGPLGRPVPSPADETRSRWNWFRSCPATRRGRMEFDAGNPMHWVAGAVMMGAVGILVLSLLLQLVLPLLGLPLPEAGFSVFDLVLGLLLLGVPPLVWVLAFYRGGVRAWSSRLFLTMRRPGVEIGLGVAAAVAMVVALIPVGYLLEFLEWGTENPVLDDLIPRLTWPVILLIAGSAAVGEELFFRGFLQPRIGIVFANVLFGLVHIGYGVALQVVVPLALGFVFSWLVVTTRSLVPAIVAHFFFNFLVLSIQKLAHDFGFF